MKPITKAILLTGGLLLISAAVKAANLKAGASRFLNFSPPIALKLSFAENALKNAGLDPTRLKFALSQLLLETGQFTKDSQVATLNNNLSGIRYINKPYQKATQGSAVPISERVQPASNPLNYYAKFSTLQDWANDYKRILSIKSKPIAANDLNEFNNRLALNGYYDTRRPNAKQNYLNLLKFYFSKL